MRRSPEMIHAINALKGLGLVHTTNAELRDLYQQAKEANRLNDPTVLQGDLWSFHNVVVDLVAARNKIAELEAHVAGLEDAGRG